MALLHVHVPSPPRKNTFVVPPTPRQVLVDTLAGSISIVLVLAVFATFSTPDLREWLVFVMSGAVLDFACLGVVLTIGRGASTGVKQGRWWQAVRHIYLVVIALLLVVLVVQSSPVGWLVLATTLGVLVVGSGVVLRQPLPQRTALLAGVLPGRAVLVVLTGVLLLYPDPVVVLVQLVVLVLTVGVAAFVLARNGWHALLQASTQVEGVQLLLLAGVGVGIAAGVPLAVQGGAWLLRPEVATLPVYPRAQQVEVGAYEPQESAPEMQVIRFVTTDDSQTVCQFYDEVLQAANWHHEGELCSAPYGYVSASGQVYRVVIQVDVVRGESWVRLRLERS
jgi:hypothetical protein